MAMQNSSTSTSNLKLIHSTLTISIIVSLSLLEIKLKLFLDPHLNFLMLLMEFLLEDREIIFLFQDWETLL